MSEEAIERKFNYIYDNCKWGINEDNRGSSGPGSHITNVRPYLELVQNFIVANGIKSITDVGCGDFQFTKYFDFYRNDDSDISYTGVDCVKSLIKYNKQKYGKKNVKFLYKEISKHSFEYSDLFIIKDVLQHLPNEILYNFLDYIVSEKLAKFIIVCNCKEQSEENQDLSEIGQTRPLDANMLPLKKYNPLIIRNYHTKQVSIITTCNQNNK